jgi:hypothetical protein
MKYSMRVQARIKLAVALMLVLYSLVLVWYCRRVGITIDEPIRLLSAQLYWTNLPDHDPKDQPPLLSIAAGWAPRLLEVPLMRDHEIWKRAWKDHIYSFILDSLPPQTIDRLFFLSRLGVICFPVLTALLIWRWSRHLFSQTVALLVVCLYLLLPSARAHGALITSDMAASFTYLLSTCMAWRYWRDPVFRNAASLGVAAGLAIIAKFSLLIVPPLALAVVVIRGLSSTSCWKKIPAAASAVAVIPLGVAVIAYKFEARMLPAQALEEMARKQEHPSALIAVAHVLKYVPIPSEMQEGIRLMGIYHRDGTRTFLLGKIYASGRRWNYFPVCLALKLPIGFQVLALAGMALLMAGLIRRTVPPDRLFLLIPPAVYLGFAMVSSIQLGIRLILPVIVFLPLITGFALTALWSRRLGKATVAALFAFIVISTGRVFPHDMSYFNEWTGGPENGWRYLSDSNIDWGQNLPDLKAYVDKHKIDRIRWFPFGFDKPYRYFTQAQLEVPFSPFTPQFIDGPIYRPKPGFYAVNVSLLSGLFYEPQYRDFLKYFRERIPVGRAGFGILIYHVR